MKKLLNSWGLLLFSSFLPKGESMINQKSNGTSRQLAEIKDINNKIQGVNTTVELSIGPLQVIQNDYFGILRMSTYVKQQLNKNTSYSFNLSSFAIPRFNVFQTDIRAADTSGNASFIEIQFQRESDTSSKLILKPLGTDILKDGGLNFTVFFWKI